MADSTPAASSVPAAPALVASTSDRVRPNAKLIALRSLGHRATPLAAFPVARDLPAPSAPDTR